MNASLAIRWNFGAAWLVGCLSLIGCGGDDNGGTPVGGDSRVAGDSRLGDPDGSDDAPVGDSDDAPAPVITLVSPNRGREGTLVTLTGQNFVAGLSVTFDAMPAVIDLNVAADGRSLSVRAPAHALGAVAITVKNPDNQQATHLAAFTYVVELGWCGLEAPLAQTAVLGGDAPSATSLVWTSGITVGAGQGAGIFVQFGVGPLATPPDSSDDWVWREGSYSADVDGLTSGDLANDRYSALLPLPVSVGVWEFAALASTDQVTWAYCDGGVGATDGYASADAGRLTVTAPSPSVTSVSPTHGPVGTLVTITGMNFVAGAGVWFGANAATQVTWNDATSLIATAPAHAVGSVEVTVKNPDAQQASLSAAFLYEDDPQAPLLQTVTPTFGSVEGGMVVTVTGSNLAGVSDITWGESTLAVTLAGDGLSFSFTAPPHAPALMSLTVENGAGKTATLAAAFRYVLRLPTSRALTLDGLASDWVSAYEVAADTTVSNWGTSNQLRRLSVAYDATALYLAIEGVVETGSTNALLVYLDRDFGGGTGVNTVTNGMDSIGALDSACSGNMNASAVTGFGAEFCLGAQAMHELAMGDVYPATDYAGLRDIASDTGNFGWGVDGDGHALIQVATHAGAGPLVEMALPWTLLFGVSGLPEAGAHLALFARISDWEGTTHANQTLPSDNSAGPEVVQAVVSVDVR